MRHDPKLRDAVWSVRFFPIHDLRTAILKRHRYPLFAFTPIQSGGLGLNEAAIGLHMSVLAFCNIAFLFLYAPLERRFGALRVYQTVMSTWALCVLFPPYLNYLAREGQEGTVYFNAVVLIFFLVWSVATLSWCKYNCRP